MTIETLLAPSDLPALARRDLRGTACVVFDILRATSTFVTALHHGAKEIIPVSEIAEAVARRTAQPEVLLAGERDGVKIRAAQSGGIDFDFGNSPREFTPERVRGKIIVSTTTNGTRALRACAKAKKVLAASFLNLTATADFLRAENEILLVCAGTGENAAAEDFLAAGALVDLLSSGKSTHTNKSSHSTAARTAYVQAMLTHLEKNLAASENGRRLLAITELHDDVAFCAQRDVFNLVARMDAHGRLQRV
jgi:2-phosphosulfolactate phosphatase